MNITHYLEQKRIEVDRFLDEVTPSADTPPTTLHESMRYSLLAGGKRVRPILAIAAAEAAVAIAIIINVYRNYQSIDVEDADELKF